MTPSDAKVAENAEHEVVRGYGGCLHDAARQLRGGFTSEPLACPEVIPTIFDYGGGGDGDPTATLAARWIAKNGQLVEITSRSDHEPGFASKTPSATFTIQTADGEVLANGTAIEVDGRWWVDHITMCDPSDLNIG